MIGKDPKMSKGAQNRQIEPNAPIRDARARQVEPATARSQVDHADQSGLRVGTDLGVGKWGVVLVYLIHVMCFSAMLLITIFLNEFSMNV